MEPGKFEKKVLKLHKQLEGGKLNAASAGAAKLSGEDLSHAQRVALMSFQVKMIRLAKKEGDARTMVARQKELVGKMAPYLAEAIRMTRDGQYDDCIPRLKGALAREEMADETPQLSQLFPSARNIVHAHLLYSLDERACMKALSRPTGFMGGEDRKHVMRFWSLPDPMVWKRDRDSTAPSAALASRGPGRGSRRGPSCGPCGAPSAATSGVGCSPLCPRSWARASEPAPQRVIQPAVTAL